MSLPEESVDVHVTCTLLLRKAFSCTEKQLMLRIARKKPHVYIKVVYIYVSIMSRATYNKSM